MKKIILLLITIFAFGAVFDVTFAAGATVNTAQDGVNKAQEAYEKAVKENGANSTEATKAKEELDSANERLDKAEANDANDMSSSNFKIEVCDKFLGKCPPKDDTTEQINWLLGKIIQNMMLALGSLSILIMTIGAGFIILHNGKDEYLTTGKNIFMGGIYAMIIALGSYYLVSIIEFIIS